METLVADMRSEINRKVWYSGYGCSHQRNRVYTQILLFDQVTEINETLASELEAIRSEDLQEVVNSNRNDLLRLSETIAEMNNSMLTPEIRDKDANPPNADWLMSYQTISYTSFLRCTSATPAPRAGLGWKPVK